MSLIICQDSKTLLWSIFSSEIDGFCARDLTEQQLIEWHRIAAAEYAIGIIRTLNAGQNPYGEMFLSYAEALKIHEEFGCEEPPSVDPAIKKTS